MMITMAAISNTPRIGPIISHTFSFAADGGGGMGVGVGVGTGVGVGVGAGAGASRANRVKWLTRAVMVLFTVSTTHSSSIHVFVLVS